MANKQYDVHLPPYRIARDAQKTMADGRPISWGIEFLRAREFDRRKMVRGVIAFVLDTEDATTHEAVSPSWEPAYSYRFTNEDRAILSGASHGLHVADTILQVFPDAVIGFLKGLRNEGSGTSTWIAAAIRWAADVPALPGHENYARVINMSLGSDSASDVIWQAMAYALKKGVVICCAAGNDGRDVDYPGAFSESITSGAIDEVGEVPDWSSRGPKVDVASPGVRIYAAYKTGYQALSGTSMATPHTTGIICWLLALGLEGDIQEFLKAHASDTNAPGFDEKTGWGIPISTKYIAALDGAEPEPPDEPKPEPKKPLPSWAWWVIGVGGVLVGALVWFLTRPQ